MTTEQAEDLVLVHNNLRLKHLKLDALAFNLAHLYHISIPHYPYLICNALLNFYAFFYIYSPYPHKSMFRKHRFHIPVSPYPHTM
jgi:hypothetical protein